MIDNVCRELFIKFMKATKAYVDAADAVSAFSVPFPIDPENDVIPQSLTWIDDLIIASDRVETARVKWLTAKSPYCASGTLRKTKLLDMIRNIK